MKKFLLPILVIVLALGLTMGVAMAHTEAAPFVTPLIAGQNIDAGDVIVWNDAGNLYVKYDTGPFDATHDWTLLETNLAVAESLEGIPQTNKGNPKVGKFPWKEEYDSSQGVTEWTYTIELAANGFDVDDVLYIAAHAVVFGSGPVETAWAEGDGFPGGSWAMYFTYTVQ